MAVFRKSENGIIDMHCHLLPGIDDGAPDMADTVRALRMAEKQDVRGCIMTPHFLPDHPIAPEQVLRLTGLVNDAAASEGIPIKIFPGMECMYCSGLAAQLDRGEALCLAGSRYVLIEFPPETAYLQIRNGVENILGAGYLPVLAHYERYDCLTEKGRVGQLRRIGCLIQMNYDTIQRRYGLLRRNPFHSDLKAGLVDCLGSDCHGSSFRKYFLPPSIDWLVRNLSPDEVRKLSHDNPLYMIENTD